MINYSQVLELDNIRKEDIIRIYDIGKHKTVKKRFIINDGKIVDIIDQKGYVGEEKEEEEYFNNLRKIGKW